MMLLVIGPHGFTAEKIYKNQRQQQDYQNKNNSFRSLNIQLGNYRNY